MANPYIWGGLERAVVDPTTIDEAIAEAITAHDDDPEAHLGPDQSLQSHRASEIIDHLAESVVNDKIKRTARRYVAIVDPTSDTDFDTIAEAVEYAKDVGGGDIFITRGTHYLAADIAAPPTIGLYGNGIGETTIKSNSSTARGFNFYTTIGTGAGSISFLASDNGHNYVAFNHTTSGVPAPVPNMILMQYDSPNYYYIVDHYDSVAHRLYLTTNIHDAVDDGEGEISGGFALTNGSQTAQLYTSLDISDLDYYPGMSIADVETGNFHRTISMDEDGLVTLAEPFTGSTSINAGYFIYRENNTINFSGLTFDIDAAPVIVGGQAGNATVYADSVQNLRFTPYSALGVGATFIGCLFDCRAQDLSFFGLPIANGTLLLNCAFNATENGSAGVIMGGEGRIIACRFLANGYTNHKWLNGRSEDFTVQSCKFESQDGVTIFNLTGSGTTGSGKFIGNHFTFENNKTLTFQLKRGMFIGNKFIFSGSGALAFNSAADDNIVMQNNVVGDITDAGARNMIRDNNVTTGGQLIVAATSDTAMALRWRESVQLTPNSTRTLTTTIAPRGQVRTLIILTSGTTSYTLTFGSGFKSTGTLATGATSVRYFIIEFLSDGTNMIETSRTVAIA